MSWPLTTIKDVAKVVTGKTPSKSEDDNFGGAIPFVTPAELNGCVYVSDSPQKITEKGASKLKLVPMNAVMVCCIGSLGKLAIAHREVATNQQINSVIFDEKKVYPKYGYYALSRLKPVMETLAPSTTVAIINKSKFEALEIPLPPLSEQKRIAAILDKADAIRRKRQQAIQLADEFLRAVFLDMFGDPNSNSKNVPALPMTEVFNIRTGSLNSNASVEGGRYPFFTCAKEVFAIDDYAFDQEALLLAGNNAQADYDVKHYKGKFNAYQRTYVLTLRNKNWSYPFYKFALEYQLANLKRVSKGSNTKYITMEIMKRTLLPVPSQYEQMSFVQYFEKVRDTQDFAGKHEHESTALFSSLSQKAFSGEL